MTFENIPKPVKDQAKERVLRRFPRPEQLMLKGLRFRNPADAWEFEVFKRFVVALEMESRALMREPQWSARVLRGLLNAAQARALDTAGRHMGWGPEELHRALFKAFPTLSAARRDEGRVLEPHETAVGEPVRVGAHTEDEKFSHWTDWANLLEDD
ncbi:MAG: hypothetical protein QOJ29_97 [Thermoleophilaceae bacterium]|jgi:hypothetical protein|nr:hypothetical protein [Thermoleophilaceae bacterium]